MGDGTFAPDASITREEAAAILYRMAGFLGNKTMPDIPQSQCYYDLNEISDWAIDSVKGMYVMDVMRGDDGYFYPKAEYTVEQAIATMIRLYECG